MCKCVPIYVDLPPWKLCQLHLCVMTNSVHVVWLPANVHNYPVWQAGVSSIILVLSVSKCRYDNSILNAHKLGAFWAPYQADS